LAVVNMANRADVNVRLVTFKLCLAHRASPLFKLGVRPAGRMNTRPNSLLNAPHSHVRRGFQARKCQFTAV
ncbi:hypothetical protein, partial [Hyphomonas sp.]|uniref:hypothetical protein n=1 Tax=Hyphomonas sp. TaxID=87 RepID=UPI00344D4725